MRRTMRKIMPRHLPHFQRSNGKDIACIGGHCAPCPEGIDIASVTKFLNLAKAQGAVPETVREHYGALPHTAGSCIRCGVCETRCPFRVPIRENMKQAAETFGK